MDARNYEEKKIANDQNELRVMIKKNELKRFTV